VLAAAVLVAVITQVLVARWPTQTTFLFLPEPHTQLLLVLGAHPETPVVIQHLTALLLGLAVVVLVLVLALAVFLMVVRY
jgi:hypothetical protein